ncbi:MAG: hypothetical protein MZW92_72070 [Comamonadaceae bacterium]|nr:hypothetical protein [Comamonadaceae bacterium]
MVLARASELAARFAAAGATSSTQLQRGVSADLKAGIGRRSTSSPRSIAEVNQQIAALRGAGPDRRTTCSTSATSSVQLPQTGREAETARRHLPAASAGAGHEAHRDGGRRTDAALARWLPRRRTLRKVVGRSHARR